MIDGNQYGILVRDKEIDVKGGYNYRKAMLDRMFAQFEGYLKKKYKRKKGRIIY